MADTLRQDYGPKISPDGSQIVFYGYDDSDSPDLYIIDVDGRNEKRLTNTPEFWEILPQWSPDGGRIFFTGGAPRGKNIYSMSVDGSGIRIETEPPHDARDFDASVALTKNQFVFFRQFDNGKRQILLQDLYGDETTILLSQNIENMEMARLGFFPDASQVLFIASMGKDNAPFPTDLYVLDLATGRARQITRTPDIWERQAMISRDGRWLMYSSDEAGTNDIYKMPAGGGEAHRITFFDAAIEFFSDLRGDLLVFDAGHYPDGETCIYRAKADGSDYQRITGSCDFAAPFNPD